MQELLRTCFAPQGENPLDALAVSGSLSSCRCYCTVRRFSTWCEKFRPSLWVLTPIPQHHPAAAASTWTIPKLVAAQTWLSDTEVPLNTAPLLLLFGQDRFTVDENLATWMGPQVLHSSCLSIVVLPRSRIIGEMVVCSRTVYGLAELGHSSRKWNTCLRGPDSDQSPRLQSPPSQVRVVIRSRWLLWWRKFILTLIKAICG